MEPETRINSDGSGRADRARNFIASARDLADQVEQMVAAAAKIEPFTEQLLHDESLAPDVRTFVEDVAGESIPHLARALRGLNRCYRTLRRLADGIWANVPAQLGKEE